MSDILQEIIRYRNQTSYPSQTIWMYERAGLKLVQVTAFEPDPNTYRDNYYYNAIDNILYTKIKTQNNTHTWKKAN